VDSVIAELDECVHHPDGCPIAGLVVKVADLAEATNYCGIFGLGDHATQVYRSLRALTYNALGDLLDYEDSMKQHYGPLHNLIRPLLDVRPA
jgi:hypothetical protein